MSRKIGEGFEGRLVAEAFEPGAIVVCDEVVDIGIALLGGLEPAMMTGGVVADAVEMFVAEDVRKVMNTYNPDPESPEVE